MSFELNRLESEVNHIMQSLGNEIPKLNLIDAVRITKKLNGDDYFYSEVLGDDKNEDFHGTNTKMNWSHVNDYIADTVREFYKGK